MAAQTPDAPPKPELEVNKLFRVLAKNRGSDLHLKVGSPPVIRLRGELRHLDMKPLTEEDIERYMFPTLNEKTRAMLEENGAVDFAYCLPEGNRFRVNLFRQRTFLSVAARRVETHIPTLDELHLPDALDKVTEYNQGLVIVCGITGSGKSTTIARLLESINERRRCHILTLEDPIEFSFSDKKAIINQREIGIDTPDWSSALRYAVREDPDVILVGEMRDWHTFNAALSATETGHLVFGTLHSSTAASTIGRILELFPVEQHHGIRQRLAFNLRAVIVQKLLPSIDEKLGRVPAIEVMFNIPQVRKAIREGSDEKLAQILQSQRGQGLIDFNESLRQLVQEEKVERAVAMQAAPNPDALAAELRGIQVSTSGLV